MLCNGKGANDVSYNTYIDLPNFQGGGVRAQNTYMNFLKKCQNTYTNFGFSEKN